MKLFVLILFTFTINTVIQAQSKTAVTISGSVSDSVTQKSVGLVTVGLYSATDTKVPVKNVLVNDKGVFEFKNIEPGNYVLFLTHTSYEEKRLSVFADSTLPVLKLGNLYLSPMAKNLSSVTVVGERKKPLVEQQEDRTIYNAEADPSNASLTALDLLRKTPLVTVDGEDNIQLNGQTNFKVLLNGKETSLFTRDPKTVLKGFPASLVKKVEVITSPSAKYDGEGIGGLINIITAKKILGYNGWAGGNYSALNTNVYTGINAKYGNFGFSGSFGASDGINPAAESFSEIKSFNPIAYNKRLSNGYQENTYSSMWGNLELSYELDSLNTLSAYADLNGGKNTTERVTNFNLILPTIIDTVKSAFLYNNHGEYPTHDWGMDYIRKSRNNKERELTVKLLNEFEKNSSYDVSEQTYSGSKKYILNDNLSNNTQRTIQVDYVEPLNKGRKLEMGMKGIFRSATSDYKNFYRTALDPKYTLIESNSNFFDYKQIVYSLYSTYRFSWKKINFRLGMRWEHTNVDGDFRSSSTAVKQDYNTFLPNIFLSKRIKNIHTLSLAYTKRLSRPYIWNLNPFASNTDTLNISYGNPNLGPQLTHNIEFGFSTFKNGTSINIKLTESFSNTDILRYSVFDDATGIRKTTSANIGATATTSLTGSINTKLTPKWTVSTNFGVRYVFLKNKFNPTQKNQGFGGNVFLYTGYEITKKFTIFTSGNYNQSPVSLQGRMRANIWYGSGLSYRMLNNKLSVSLVASNFLSKYRTWTSISSDENFSTYSEVKNVLQAIGISLNWQFGKLSENVSKKRGVSNDDLKAKD